MHLIKSIEITNFRSIQHEVINCAPYNLFCGLNDVGKSNVLKALNLFFNGETDFKTPIDFAKDYNKVALAKAQKSNKQKQQIKIKLTFNIPNGYKSLSAFKHFSVEKTYDRYSTFEIKYLEGESKERASQARIVNRIRYVYIPALKGESVIEYLMGLLGDYQLVDGSTIDTMNTQINNSTKDLSELLQASHIGTGAYFGLPTLLSDFWQQLTVNTAYEQFTILDAIEGTVKDKGRKLNMANYQIPLTLRGEGIKSKYIPPILQWLQKNNTKDTYVWGIDEPENSLEFRASEYLSDLFCNEYALSTQIFGTTHSMAFINPPDDAKTKPVVFRCLKTNTGATTIKTIDDLFKEQDKQELLDELGVLEIQKHIIQEFRVKIGEIEIYKIQVANLTEDLQQVFPQKIFICEDEDAVAIWSAWFLEYGIDSVDIRSSKGCTTNIIEDSIRELRKKRQNYQPYIFRELDRDGYTNEQVAVIKSKRENLYNDLNTYKVSFLPVYEIENFIILLDSFFTEELLVSKCDENLMNSFIQTAKTNIRYCRKWDQKLFKENTEINMWINAKKDMKKHLPGKEICKLKNNNHFTQALKSLKINNFPQELNDYLMEIKIYFD